MAVIELRESSGTAFADGMAFGAVGPYELVRTVAAIAIDPASPANAAITDIDRARREADGLVHLESDVMLLRPYEPARGNGGLLAVVPNRGSVGGAVPFSLANRPAMGEGLRLDPGDGWPLRHGWTIAWAGWQYDVPPADLLGCRVPPVVDGDDRPLAGTVRMELQAMAPATSIALRSNSATYSTVPYPAADPRQPDAQLRRARGRRGPWQLVDRGDWAFGRDVDGRFVADPKRLWVHGGVSPEDVFELCYRTEICPFVGGGLAAFRDVMSHLRQGLRFSIAMGRSQSGRFLRELLWCGMNVDEAGQPVFDAVIPFIAGASRGEFNQRYGQPAEALAPGLGHRPPFALAPLLARQRTVGGLPKVVLVNSASEYWRADGSLGHIATDEAADLPELSGTRQYLLASTEHVSGAPVTMPVPDARRSRLRDAPLHRAILELVRRWVVDGMEPPPSRVPRLADGTAVDRSAALATFDRLGIRPLPTMDQFAVRYELDLGPLADAGVATYPAGRGRLLPAYVSTVDADGNELAGVRHPEVSVPLATHTGWTTLLAQSSRWESIAFLLGSSHPFAATAQLRDPADPRPAIADRYPTREAYLTRVRAAAQVLVGEGFLLAEDVDYVLATAGRNYDELTAIS
jgi:hypothetical protein